MRTPLPGGPKAYLEQVQRVRGVSERGQRARLQQQAREVAARGPPLRAADHCEGEHEEGHGDVQQQRREGRPREGARRRAQAGEGEGGEEVRGEAPEEAGDGAGRRGRACWCALCTSGDVVVVVGRRGHAGVPVQGSAGG